ncbi:MAG TPA: class D sortase [Terriglobia bacterium]|nr:class D sortase [Terriglobia bacterium]
MSFALREARAALSQTDQFAERQASSLKAYVAAHLGELRRARSTTTDAPAGNAASGSLPSSRPRARLAEGTLIGRLEVPRLGLSTIVLEGDSDPVLREALGHIPGTSLPGASGNVAIAGHRDTFFRALKDIRKHDSIVLDTTAGAYRYDVRSMQIVAPDDTQVLKPSSHGSLTLVTCYPFYYVGSAPKRYIVHAEEIGPARPEKAASSSNRAILPAPAASSEVRVAYRPLPSTVRHEPAHRLKRRSHVHRASNLARGAPGGSANQEQLAENAPSTEDPSPDPTVAPQRKGRFPKAGRRLVSWFKSLPKRVAGN